MYYRILLISIVSLTLSCGEEIFQEPSQARDMSVATRWVLVRAPGAEALLEAPARVVATSPAAAEVTVLHTARIERFHVGPGDQVKAGQPVADVVIAEVSAAAARLSSTRVQLKAVSDRLEALKGLRREGLARTEQLFELTRQVGELTSTLNLAQAVLHIYGLSDADARRVTRRGHLTLSSPCDGVVTQMHGRLGGVISPAGSPLVLIEGPRPSRIEASLVGSLPEGMQATFIGRDGRQVALQSKPLTRWMDGHTGRLLVWLSPVKPVVLPDGLAGRVRLTPRAGAVEVPSRALLQEASGPSVLVLDGESPRPVPVRVLLNSGTTALVQGDLKPGQRVAQDAKAVKR